MGIFVLVRKVFIYFNAFLGIYFMLKLSGISFFSHEGLSSIITGILGIGYNYLEVIKSFTNKALNSTLEFFNYKIIPNDTVSLPSSPSGKNGNNNSWFDLNQWTSLRQGSSNKVSLPQSEVKAIVRPSNIIDVIEDKSFSLRKIYMDGLQGDPANQSLPTNNPWYKDLTTWYYIIGGIAVTVSIIGLGYIAYSYLYSGQVLPDPDVSPPSPTTGTSKGLEDQASTTTDHTTPPASPASDTSTIRPPKSPVGGQKGKGIQLQPINTDNLPPVPKVETPLNPWTTPTGWRRPSLTPIPEVGIKPGFTNPLSPGKVTNTDPSVISSLPPTPTDVKPSSATANGLDSFIDSL